MQVAIFGTGRIGALHAATLAHHVDVSRLLIADTVRDRAVSLASQLGAEAASVDEALGGHLDAVVIATPTASHADLIRRCLDKGVPIFCEKPLTLDWQTSVEIVELVEDSGAMLQVGFQRRFDPGYRAAKKLIEDGTVGRLYTIRMAAYDPVPPHESYLPTSGGIFRDMHIHDFDILRWLTGQEVETVMALGSVQHYEMFERYDDVDTSACVAQMTDGALAVFTGGRRNARGYDVRAEIVGHNDSIAVGLDPQMPLRSVEPGMTPPEQRGYASFQERFRDAYEEEIAAFLRLCQGKAPNICTGRDGLEALRVALAADRSFKERRLVSVREIGASTSID